MTCLLVFSNLRSQPARYFLPSLLIYKVVNHFLRSVGRIEAVEATVVVNVSNVDQRNTYGREKLSFTAIAGLGRQLIVKVRLAFKHKFSLAISAEGAIDDSNINAGTDEQLPVFLGKPMIFSAMANNFEGNLSKATVLVTQERIEQFEHRILIGIENFTAPQVLFRVK